MGNRIIHYTKKARCASALAQADEVAGRQRGMLGREELHTSANQVAANQIAGALLVVDSAALIFYVLHSETGPATALRSRISLRRTLCKLCFVVGGPFFWFGSLQQQGVRGSPWTEIGGLL